MMKLTIMMMFPLLILFSSCSKKVDFDTKVLNLVVDSEVKGMDPVFAEDLYSGREIARVYEGLLEYEYLVRPYKLGPNLAESLPEVSKDGLTYTFKILKGVYFHDDEAFSGGKG